MSPSLREKVNRLSVYAGAVSAALVFWLFESFMKVSSQSATTWVDSLIPGDPVELWARFLVGAVIIGLVLDYHGKSRKIRHLEEQLCSEQRGAKS
jgi:hypothetical protein